MEQCPLFVKHEIQTVRTNDQLLSHLGLWSKLGMCLNWLYHCSSPSSYLRAGFQILPTPVAEFGARKGPQTTFLGWVIQRTRRRTNDHVHWALSRWCSDPQPHRLHLLSLQLTQVLKALKSQVVFSYFPRRSLCVFQSWSKRPERYKMATAQPVCAGAHLYTALDSLFAWSSKSVAAQKFACTQWKGAFGAWFIVHCADFILTYLNLNTACQIGVWKREKL